MTRFDDLQRVVVMYPGVRLVSVQSALEADIIKIVGTQISFPENSFTQ